jgi:hypothetical protein
MAGKAILVSSIEGRVIDKLNGECCILVDDDPNNVEYISDWLVNNLPSPGGFIRIEVMTFPELGSAA